MGGGKLNQVYHFRSTKFLAYLRKNHQALLEEAERVPHERDMDLWIREYIRRD